MSHKIVWHKNCGTAHHSRQGKTYLMLLAPHSDVRFKPRQHYTAPHVIRRKREHPHARYSAMTPGSPPAHSNRGFIAASAQEHNAARTDPHALPVDCNTLAWDSTHSRTHSTRRPTISVAVNDAAYPLARIALADHTHHNGCSALSCVCILDVHTSYPSACTRGRIHPQ